MEKHLDKIYRRRWELFHLQSGEVLDSREINWRDVPWRQVVKIIVHMNGQVHEFNNRYPGFKAFMNLRWGGREAKFEGGQYIGHAHINLWTVGWTDGQTCFLTDIDFFTGSRTKDYAMPISELVGHVHQDFKEELCQQP
jgi:hypothetical protein